MMLIIVWTLSLAEASISQKDTSVQHSSLEGTRIAHILYRQAINCRKYCMVKEASKLGGNVARNIERREKDCRRRYNCTYYLHSTPCPSLIFYLPWIWRAIQTKFSKVLRYGCLTFLEKASKPHLMRENLWRRLHHAIPLEQWRECWERTGKKQTLSPKASPPTIPSPSWIVR